MSILFCYYKSSRHENDRLCFKDLLCFVLRTALFIENTARKSPAGKNCMAFIISQVLLPDEKNELLQRHRCIMGTALHDLIAVRMIYAG